MKRRACSAERAGPPRCGFRGRRRVLQALVVTLALLQAPAWGHNMLWQGHAATSGADTATAAVADSRSLADTAMSDEHREYHWRASVVPRDPSRRKSVAVCFFGLTRSLSMTIGSIGNSLIGPLQKAGFNVHIFVHTYDLGYVENHWSRERNALNTTEWLLLEPLGLVETHITSQSKFMHEDRAEFELCESHGAPNGWPNDGNAKPMLHHHLCQLNSLKHVSALWQKWHETENYTAVIYARPDVLFNCPLPASMVDNVQPNTLYTPDVNKYGGLNDRFAFAAPDVARIYGNRLNWTYTQCHKEKLKKNAPHAERFLGNMVREMGINSVDVPRFSFYRVRSTGMVSMGDLPQKPCNTRGMGRLRVELRQLRIAAIMLGIMPRPGASKQGIIPEEDEFAAGEEALDLNE